MSDKEKNEQIDLNEMKKLRDEFSDTKGKFAQELENIKVEFSKKLNATKDKIVNVVSKNPQKVIAMASLLTIGASMVAAKEMEAHNTPTTDNNVVAVTEKGPRIKANNPEYIEQTYDLPEILSKYNIEVTGGLSNNVYVDEKKQIITENGKVNLDKEKVVEILSDEEISRIEEENGIEISVDDVVTRLSNSAIAVYSGKEIDEILDKMIDNSDKTAVKLSNGILAVTEGKQKDTASEKVNLDKENATEVTSSIKDEIEKPSDSGKKEIEELSKDELDKVKSETDDRIIILKDGIVAVIKGSSQTRKRIYSDKEKTAEITDKNDIKELSDDELGKLKRETNDMER